MLKKMSYVVIPTLCLLALASPVKSDDIEFMIFSMDSTHGGTANTYYAEICMWTDSATGVRMYDGTDWTDLENDGPGNFFTETDDFTSLSGLIDHIKGAGQKLEITHSGSVSIYSFTIKGDTTEEFDAIAAEIPSHTPIITVVPDGIPPSESTVALSWTWEGNTGDDVTCMCVGAEARVGGNWLDVYDECSDDDPAQILITDTETDIDFSGHPGPYEEVEYWVGYGNLNDVSGGVGTIISGWTLDSGDDLFGDDLFDDEVLEVFVAEDFVVVPEPMTLSLLAIGGLATLIRRKQ